MEIYKSKWFCRWSEKEGLTDKSLCSALKEMNEGLIDADLGGHVFNKRVGLKGIGKRSGLRTILAFKSGGSAFFIYGFSKNERDNISTKELEALKSMAHELLNYDAFQLAAAVKSGSLVEVK